MTMSVSAAEAVESLVERLRAESLRLAQDNDRLRAENKRLAKENGDLLDDLHEAREQLRAHADTQTGAL